jgi:hypothetical protein
MDDGENLPQSDYGGLCADEKFIYWNAGGNILRVSKDGGKPEVVASENVGVGVDMVVDGEKVYRANHGYYSPNSPTRPSPIYVVSKQGGEVTRLDAGYASGVIAQGRTAVYIASLDTIYSFAK